MVWCLFDLDLTDPSAGFDMKVSVSQKLQCDLTLFTDQHNFCGIIGNDGCRNKLIQCNLLVGECEGNNDTHHCYLFNSTFVGTVCCELQENRVCKNISMQVPAGKCGIDRPTITLIS